MTLIQAYEILDVSANADTKELKKKYRQLMHQVHPDSDAFKRQEYPYSAQEINEAYEVLCHAAKEKNTEKRESYRETGSSHTASQAGRHRKYGYGGGEAAGKWDAPQNPNAYRKRKIFHKIEDMDGNTIGAVEIAEGKYLWNLEEDFSLFMKSIFECSERLLSEIDRERGEEKQQTVRLRFQAELAYLLAQQFIDAGGVLEKLLTPVETKNTADIYYIPAMLETGEYAAGLRAGMTLCPEGVRQHRLYLQTRSGREAGYLSLRDDRLYHIVIPLLEQRRVQVKIEVSVKQDRKNTRGRNKYKNIDFWLRIPKEAAGTFPESIGLQIQGLLDKYKAI